MKRFFDLLVSALLLVVIIIPLALLSLVIAFTSKGPVLYWSKRIGKDNKPFYMPKFRTMIIQAPEVATHLLENPSSFYTPIGQFLRKYSIDELPQLYSIMVGDMSLVGPRPALHNQNDLIQLRTNAGVHNLVPGITGLAQVSGRDDISIETKVELDALYLTHISFFYDLYIIWLTLVKVITRADIAH
tara:strand:- start:1053 stop:1613 length:561 start_codon:yes stop_codon:yes gene_type:complete